MRSPEQLERFRMLDYITLLQNAANAGRAAHELTTAEVNQLKALSDGQYDRAANWISNLLCVYYEHCRPPRTGGEVGGDKSLREPPNATRSPEENMITLAPNPAQTWTTLTFFLLDEPANGRILVKDIAGRVLLTERFAGRQGQVVLDARQLSKGTYTVECITDAGALKTDRLIVQ
ncbi:MAG: T9SS type A sorting domain-containing protein [Flavobacteriales bacterium]